MNRVPASVAFPSGCAAVDWEFSRFRQGHSSPGRWRQWRRPGSRRVQEERGGRRWEDGERNCNLLLRVFEVFSSRAVSFGGQRGDDCIDGICSQVGREREAHSNGAKLLMQKSSINHRVQCNTVWNLNQNKKSLWRLKPVLQILGQIGFPARPTPALFLAVRL